MKDHKEYRMCAELLISATQQIELLDLEDMRGYLVAKLEVTTPENDLQRRKIQAAKDQLAMIEAAKVYIGQVYALIGKNIEGDIVDA
jgi:hypothetical protein